MKRVLFICRDNACLSLIAHALGQRFCRRCLFEPFRRAVACQRSRSHGGRPPLPGIPIRCQRLDAPGAGTPSPADLAVLLGEEAIGLSLPCPVIRLPLPQPDGQEEEAYGMVIETIEKEIWRLRQEFLEGRYAK